MYRQISTITELQKFLRSSINLWDGVSSIKSAPLLRLYHPMIEAEKVSKSTIPRRDYSLKQDVARANCTITRLCEEGKICEARQIFEVMPERDVISWTALISGYMKRGLVGEARELFNRVDAVRNDVTWTAMISGYLKTKRVAEAEKLFDEMPERNVVAWNTMIEGYVRIGEIDQALVLFERMRERNILSWNTVIAGLVSCGRVEEARGVFDRMPARNVVSWNILISGLSRNGRVDEARLLFDRMPERSVVSWNAMITGFMQNGELEKGRRLFDEMPGKNVVSWTAVISGYTQHGRSEEALRMFHTMSRSRRVRPNEGTFASVLGACSDLAGLVEGLQVHQVISKTVYRESEFVISSLINMYSKCGDVVMARKVFDRGMRRRCRDLVCWNSMISAYAHHGCGRDAIMVFEEMRSRGVKPNNVTYVGLLSACSHAGLVQEGLDYFEMLVKSKSIEVREEHYTCIIDLYGRAGRLEEALELIKKLQTKASINSWCTLLLGCNIHGNDGIEKQILEKLLDVETAGNAGTYALVSSSYAARGKTMEAEMVRLRMKKEGLKKQPGCSWIEVGNKFHVFVVGDRCSEDHQGMQSLVFDLHEKMKKIGDGGDTLLFDNE
ncbi:pentatricopeptide repeat-containing protein At2g35030, mitochondrial-like [Salvia miltiorrhiza]|uniref:pentatricopeptide repeat-containing protein At2g35030, mitochondrial-like n=1 Tax=Salvia miltiorrhiza TaxID=226208 RepID=UPI0025AC8354|nr:pentatricopeptide repeat-containing protein At2g35030, mitochondrial-like [Salvia miltiorrhiza]